MSVNGSSAPAERTLRRRVVSVLCALALLPLAALAAPSPATRRDVAVPRHELGGAG